MRDQFTTGDHYLFFAPTDEACAALPNAERAALPTNPQALTRLLKGYLLPVK